nr:hypothetical protein [Tanacetum cinerariifolium]
MAATRMLSPGSSEQYTTGIIGVRWKLTSRQKSTSIEEQYEECTYQKGEDEKVEKNSPKNIEPWKKKERKRYSHVHHVDKVAAVGSIW